MDYQVLSTIEEPGFEGDKPTSTFRVRYMVGKDGPFYARFPEAEFTPEKVERALSDRARDVKRIRGEF